MPSTLIFKMIIVLVLHKKNPILNRTLLKKTSNLCISVPVSDVVSFGGKKDSHYENESRDKHVKYKDITSSVPDHQVTVLEH
jgi:hypothetical protein